MFLFIKRFLSFLLYATFLLYILASCKLTAPPYYGEDQNLSPAELKAIYDDQNFVLRASQAQDSSHITFEVCRSTDATGNNRKQKVQILTGSCVPAFLDAQSQPFVLASQDLTKNLNQQDISMITDLLAADLQHLEVQRETLLPKAVLRDIGHGVMAGLVIGLPLALLPTSPLFNVVFLLLLTGAALCLVEDSTSRGSESSQQDLRCPAKLREGLRKIQNFTTEQLDQWIENFSTRRMAVRSQSMKLLQEQEDKRTSLGELVVHWDYIKSTDPDAYRKVNSVFHTLTLLGSYFKTTLPEHNISRYCYPPQDLRTRRFSCQNL